MKEFAKAFYFSPSWRRIRKSYIAERKAKDGGLCEMCHESLGYIVHHKIWLTPENINDISVTLNPNNFMYVCHNCHNKIEDEENKKSGNRYCFDEDGNLIPTAP